MSLPVRGPTDSTDPKPVDSDIASSDPWAEAFKTLDADEQKQFIKADTDLLGVLAAVSESLMKVEQHAGLQPWLAQV
jgi:hypothetical protein